jgi:acyl-CoA thioester hydrolase
MEYTDAVKIYHSDTDCYNVVWHGSYIKWLEIGRIEFSEKIGIKFAELDKMNIRLPVVEINIRYKNPAKLFEELEIKTTLYELKKTSATFWHEIKNINTGMIILTATSVIVCTDTEGKLFRTMPEYLYEKYKNSMPD